MAPDDFTRRCVAMVEQSLGIVPPINCMMLRTATLVDRLAERGQYGEIAIEHATGPITVAITMSTVTYFTTIYASWCNDDITHKTVASAVVSQVDNKIMAHYLDEEWDDLEEDLFILSTS